MCSWSFLARPPQPPDPAAAAVVKLERPAGRTTLPAACSRNREERFLALVGLADVDRRRLR